MDHGYTKEELKLFQKLNSPKKIQDFLNSLKFNFEKNGETCYSPREVVKRKTAHCMEGAMFAWCALEFNGQESWMLDLRATKGDFDHVVCVFKKFGCFGAISKTNHAVLRYREPVYKTIRELVLSYFHEYFLNNGNKTLREYSELLNLQKFDSDKNLKFGEDWRTSSRNLFFIPQTLDKIKHYKILSSFQAKNLRKADKVEIDAGKLVEWKKR